MAVGLCVMISNSAGAISRVAHQRNVEGIRRAKGSDKLTEESWVTSENWSSHD